MSERERECGRTCGRALGRARVSAGPSRRPAEGEYVRAPCSTLSWAVPGRPARGCARARTVGCDPRRAREPCVRPHVHVCTHTSLCTTFVGERVWHPVCAFADVRVYQPNPSTLCHVGVTCPRVWTTSCVCPLVPVGPVSEGMGVRGDCSTCLYSGIFTSPLGPVLRKRGGGDRPAPQCEDRTSLSNGCVPVLYMCELTCSCGPESDTCV